MIVYDSYNTYDPHLQDIHLMLERKNKSYGDSVGKSADLLSILFPSGISTDCYRRVHIIVRLLDKISRLACENIPKEAAIDAWNDIAGYAIKAKQLEESFDDTRKDG